MYSIYKRERNMECSTIGKTELKLPEIIFGTSALGNLYQAYTYETKLAIVKECIKNIQQPVFDTAGKYGAGLALELLGKSLRQLEIQPENVNAVKIKLPGEFYMDLLRTGLINWDPSGNNN
jgi:aryl-alcohol dehydrogenase-like predicted oxidoreductase